MRTRSRFAIVLLLTAAAAAAVSARQLRPHTLAAFDRYVALTEARMAGEIDGRSPFLWIDRRSVPQRTALVARLARGEVVSERLETRDGSREIDVDDGLIHHWIGTVFIPGATLDRVTAFVQDYERYPDAFEPLIQSARVVGRSPDRFEVEMRTSMKKVVTVVIDARYDVEYRRVSPTRLYTKSVAQDIHQVHDAGTKDERTTPGDESSGYLWRLNTYCWFEEQPDGTYEQCESISLTRGIPFGLGWIVRPFVTGIPRETLEHTLSRVRAGAGVPAP